MLGRIAGYLLLADLSLLLLLSMCLGSPTMGLASAAASAHAELRHAQHIKVKHLHNLHKAILASPDASRAALDDMTDKVRSREK